MKKLFASLTVLLALATSAFAQNFDFPNSPTANQIISGPAGQAMKWDGTKWVAQFGTVGGPFLPLAGGTMTGTLVGSDGGSWATTGINSVKALGIGVAAPTAAGNLLQATYNGNGAADFQISNNSTGANAASMIYFTNSGSNSSWVAFTGTGFTAQGPNIPGDAFEFATNGANGIVLSTNATVQPGAPIVFWSGPAQTAIMRQVGTGQGSLILPNNVSTALYIGPTTAPSGALVGVGVPNMNLVAGAHYDGTNWDADSTSAYILSEFTGGFQFTQDQGTLTVGASFSPTKIASLNGSGFQWIGNQNSGNGLGAQNLSTGNNAAGQVAVSSSAHTTTLGQFSTGYNANPYFPANASFLETDAPNDMYIGSYVGSTNINFNITGAYFGIFKNASPQIQGLQLPGYGGLIGNATSGIMIGNGYLAGTTFANVDISGAAYTNGSGWIADGGAGGGATLLAVGGGTCITMYNAGGTAPGAAVGFAVIGQWCGSGDFVGHISNLQEAPAPRVSSGALVRGSRDTFGWITGVTGGQTTLSFWEEFEGQSDCTLTSAGQPNLWFTANQTSQSVTFACVVPWTGQPCADGAMVEYHCAGLGDERNLTRTRNGLLVGDARARAATVPY